MEGERYYDDFSDEVSTDELGKTYEQLVKDGIKESLDGRRGDPKSSNLTAFLLIGASFFATAQCNDNVRGSTVGENPVEYSVTEATFLK